MSRWDKWIRNHLEWEKRDFALMVFRDEKIISDSGLCPSCRDNAEFGYTYIALCCVLSRAGGTISFPGYICNKCRSVFVSETAAYAIYNKAEEIIQIQIQNKEEKKLAARVNSRANSKAVKKETQYERMLKRLEKEQSTIEDSPEIERRRREAEKVFGTLRTKKKQEKRTFARRPGQSDTTSVTNQVIVRYGVKRKVKVRDFLVRASDRMCHKKGHRIEDITAIVKVMDLVTRKIKKVEITAGYCNNCKAFFILDRTYRELKETGHIMCKVCKRKDFNIIHGSPGSLYDMAPESLLMMYGYSVSESRKLTQQDRRAILSMILDENAMTKTQIISYLDGFIRIRKNDERMETAISKWNADIKFVSSYKTGSYRKVSVDRIVK